LARFNVQASTSDGSVFTGLPSPVAAALVAGFVWSFHAAESSLLLTGIGAVVTSLAGLLMVSNFSYPSFKMVDFRGKVPFMVILSMVMGFVVITIDPPRILFAMAVIFSLSAPVKWVFSKVRFEKS
jgi:CDP-diacylglycerol--serine O-phosphatidyltransferase